MLEIVSLLFKMTIKSENPKIQSYQNFAIRNFNDGGIS